MVKYSILNKKEIKMKDIPNFEKRYAITVDGKVWSYPKGTNRDGKFLKAHDDSHGYFLVNLTLKKENKTKQKVFKVHKLVALTYLGEPNGLVVNHKDGNKRNNTVENLEYVTSGQNNAHAYRTGLKQPTRQDRDTNVCCKLNTKDFNKTLDRVLNGEHLPTVAKEVGFTRTHLSKMFKKFYKFGNSRKTKEEDRKMENLENYNLRLTQHKDN